MKYLFALLFLPSLFMLGCGNTDDSCEDTPKPLTEVISEEMAADTSVLIQMADEGYWYQIIEPGTAVRPNNNASVTVNYRGTFTDGSSFDETPGFGTASAAPIKFNSLQGLIRGWILGIPRIGAGGKIKLYLPPNLAYGTGGTPGICPNSELIFDIELVSFINN